jgi:acetylornithine deacetylase/succinyl-diaminopimelate desuccinylase-like protein
MSAAVEAWLTENKPRLLEELLGFIAQPSVSTDPAYAAGMAGASAILEARLKRIGMHNVQRLNAGGHDAVYASWLDAPGQPTILVYGHYDVQPPDPLALWETPPVEPTIRDGNI